MGEFQYRAIDQNKKTVQGKMTAPNMKAAQTLLNKKKLKIINLQDLSNKKAKVGTGKKTPILGEFLYRDENNNIQMGLSSGPSMTSKDLVIFTRQFATMLQSGVALIQSLKILGSQQRVKKFGDVILEIAAHVEQGAPLSDALAKYPTYFNGLYVSLVKAGERSGKLDVILQRLFTYIEKSSKIKSQVKGAMTYPIVILVLAVVLVVGMLIFVLPAMTKQFTDSGKPLPGLTQALLDLSNLLKNYFIEGIATIIVAFFAIRAYIKTEKGSQNFDKFILKVPAIGDLVKKIVIARFCQTLSTMLSAGVSILESLTICADSAGNYVYTSVFKSTREAVSQGSTVAQPLTESQLFPEMMTSMVSVGEATGALDDMLSKVSLFYEEEVDLAIKTVLSLIEPVLLVVVGGIIGFIVIAMYLPMFDMASNV